MTARHRSGGRFLPAAALAALLTACSPLVVRDFAGTSPVFAPERFFEGATSSWGVIEGRSGEPLRSLRTETSGRVAGDGALELDQTLTFGDGEVRRRSWRLVRVGEGKYRATASDISGEAVGEASGRALRMEYALQLAPGSRWRTAHATHWMYLADDGETMLNRVVLSKFGVVLATVSETFRRRPAG